MCGANQAPEDRSFPPLTQIVRGYNLTRREWERLHKRWVTKLHCSSAPKKSGKYNLLRPQNSIQCRMRLFPFTLDIVHYSVLRVTSRNQQKRIIHWVFFNFFITQTGVYNIVTLSIQHRCSSPAQSHVLGAAAPFMRRARCVWINDRGWEEGRGRTDPSFSNGVISV